MRLGLSTPAVTVYPPTASEWEHSADIEDIACIAVVADELGFHHLTCSERVAGVSATARDASHYCDQPARLRDLVAGEGHGFTPVSGISGG